jgi:hypothetical protein
VATESTRGLGGRRVRLAAGALVASVSVFLYAVAAPGHARAAGPDSASVPAIPGVSEASAGAAGADEPALSSLAPQSEPAPTDQASSTQQTASSAASAAQQQPQNIVISIRINSPGDDGPITQINAAVGAAGSANNSATGQNAGSGAGTGQGGAQQNASTDQAADSSASSSQDQPQNTVISIRINSPGDNGAIEQQNLTVSISSSGNVSVTGQQQGQSDASADGTAGSQSTPTGTKALLAATPSQGRSRRTKGDTVTSKAAPPAARKASSTPAATPPASGPSHGSTWHAAVAPAERALVVAASAKHTLGTAAHRLVPRPLARTTRRLAAAPRDAAAALRNLTPRPTPEAAHSGPNISSAAVLTLVAVLGAFAVLLGSRLMGRAPGVLGRGNWRLR